MKPLPTKFNNDGFTLTQLFREKDVAVYVKTKERPGRPDVFNSYEIIKVRARKGPAFGEAQEDSERYPCDADWGRNGWTTNSEDRAREIAKALLEGKPVHPEIKSRKSNLKRK